MTTLSEATGPAADLFDRYREIESEAGNGRFPSVPDLEGLFALADAIRCHGFDPAHPDQERHFSLALAQAFRLRDGRLVLDGRHLSGHESAAATAAANRAWSELEAAAEADHQGWIRRAWSGIARTLTARIRTV